MSTSFFLTQNITKFVYTAFLFHILDFIKFLRYRKKNFKYKLFSKPNKRSFFNIQPSILFYENRNALTNKNPGPN